MQPACRNEGGIRWRKRRKRLKAIFNSVWLGQACCGRRLLKLQKTSRFMLLDLQKSMMHSCSIPSPWQMHFKVWYGDWAKLTASCIYCSFIFSPQSYNHISKMPYSSYRLEPNKWLCRFMWLLSCFFPPIVSPEKLLNSVCCMSLCSNINHECSKCRHHKLFYFNNCWHSVCVQTLFEIHF